MKMNITRRKYLFDLETDGLYDEVTKIHCIGMIDLDNGDELTFAGDAISKGLDVLSNAELLIAHNGIKYDIPVIKKLYPNWKTNAVIRDTLVLSRLAYPETTKKDLGRKIFEQNKRLIGSHSLKAWGFRLKILKDDFGETTDWKVCTPEMIAYCLQDCRVAKAIWDKFSSHVSEESMVLEHQVATIVQRLEQRGVAFDKDKAIDLYEVLKKRLLELKKELQESFGSWYVSEGLFTPKKDNRNRGYTKGSMLVKIKLIEFNPASRDHISRCLQVKYDWKPTIMTETGKPMIDEGVLKKLDYPEAKLLSEYLMINKRIGQLAEGKNAWLKLEKNERIHGSINTNGTVTGRCSHSNPNLGQVVSVASPYGKECRELFKPSEGMVLFGVDASALELRCLAGFMSRYDGGSYINTVVNGKKSDGTEIHTVNMKALQITSRDLTKRWFYGFIYGAGDQKLGEIVGKGANEGKRLRHNFLKNVPALQKLQDKVCETVDKKGFLLGLDKRKLSIRSQHSALNTLLQSAGAIIVKKALCLLDEYLQAEGLKFGIDYEFVLFVHDELQIEIKPKHIELIQRLAEKAFIDAGTYFNFKCPIASESKVGTNWAETH